MAIVITDVAQAAHFVPCFDDQDAISQTQPIVLATNPLGVHQASSHTDHCAAHSLFSGLVPPVVAEPELPATVPALFLLDLGESHTDWWGLPRLDPPRISV